VPALAATTGTDVDLNKELKAHGVSNLLCGLFGGLQTYMAYSCVYGGRREGRRNRGTDGWSETQYKAT